jgi:hypothetical protein
VLPYASEPILQVAIETQKRVMQGSSENASWYAAIIPASLLLLMVYLTSDFLIGTFENLLGKTFAALCIQRQMLQDWATQQLK